MRCFPTKSARFAHQVSEPESPPPVIWPHDLLISDKSLHCMVAQQCVLQKERYDSGFTLILLCLCQCSDYSRRQAKRVLSKVQQPAVGHKTHTGRELRVVLFARDFTRSSSLFQSRIDLAYNSTSLELGIFRRAGEWIDTSVNVVRVGDGEVSAVHQTPGGES